MLKLPMQQRPTLAYQCPQIDYCQYYWPAKKPTGIAVSDAELHEMFQERIAAVCPGDGCVQKWRSSTRHEMTTQEIPPQLRKAVPPFLAYEMISVVRRHVSTLALRLADEVDRIALASVRASIAPGSYVLLEAGSALTSE